MAKSVYVQTPTRQPAKIRVIEDSVYTKDKSCEMFVCHPKYSRESEKNDYILLGLGICCVLPLNPIS
jgi:hypothetical protein